MGYWLAKPRRANGYAVVASILLVVGAVLLSIRWGSIDRQSFDELDIDDLAAHLAQRHEQSLTEADAWMFLTEAHAAFELSRTLDVERVIVFEMSQQGLSFVGAAAEQSPTMPIWGQIMYSMDETRSGAVSVFLLANRGPLAVQPTLPALQGQEIWMRWTANDTGVRGLLGSDETLIYVLISHDTAALQAAANRIGDVLRSR